MAAAMDRKFSGGGMFTISPLKVGGFEFDTLSTMAKSPGLQAGMEKGYGAGFAAVLGCRSFNGGGLLSFNDIFSPEQMTADIELRDEVQRLTKNAPEPPVDKWLDIIEECFEKGYMDTDTTLDNYKDVYFIPDMLDRSTLHSFMGQRHHKSLEDKITERAIEKIEKFSYI